MATGHDRTTRLCPQNILVLCSHLHGRPMASDGPVFPPKKPHGAALVGPRPRCKRRQSSQRVQRTGRVQNDRKQARTLTQPMDPNNQNLRNHALKPSKGYSMRDFLVRILNIILRDQFDCMCRMKHTLTTNG